MPQPPANEKPFRDPPPVPAARPPTKSEREQTLRRAGLQPCSRAQGGDRWKTNTKGRGHEAVAGCGDEPAPTPAKETVGTSRPHPGAKKLWGRAVPTPAKETVGTSRPHPGQRNYGDEPSPPRPKKLWGRAVPTPAQRNYGDEPSPPRPKKLWGRAVPTPALAVALHPAARRPGASGRRPRTGGGGGQNRRNHLRFYCLVTATSASPGRGN
jgi:hypothetical protein